MHQWFIRIKDPKDAEVLNLINVRSQNLTVFLKKYIRLPRNILDLICWFLVVEAVLSLSFKCGTPSCIISSVALYGSIIPLVFICLVALPHAPAFVGQVFLREEINDLMRHKLYEITKKNDNFLDQDESLFLEFKTSFQTSYPERPQKIMEENGNSYFMLRGNKKHFQSEKEIQNLLQEKVLVSIIGFLNASGGRLVLGINEKHNIKKVIGIEHDGFASDDDYERHIIQQIINRIGKSFLGDYINTECKKINSKTICIINIKPFVPKAGQIPALLDKEKCFQRTGPRTDPIEPGFEFATFVANRINA